MYKAELVLDIKTQLGEGPVWNSEDACLYFLDIEGYLLIKYHPRTGHVDKFKLPSMCGTFAFGDDGLIYLMAEEGLTRFNPELASFQIIGKPSDLGEGFRFNDGKCGPNGDFYVGSMHMNENQPASMYRVNGSGDFRNIEKEAYRIPNGLSWTEDGKSLYHIDTVNRNVNRFDYKLTTGDLSNKTLAFHLNLDGYPDGMTIDRKGYLWIALYDGYKVVRCNPHTGQVVDQILVDCQRPTSLVFAGDDLNELYITSSARPGTGGQYPGGLFKAKLPVGGYELGRFKVL